MKRAGKNIVLNLLLTGFNFLYPLITSYIISNKLGAELIGRVNFSQSLSAIVVAVSSLGINVYGVKEIAKSEGTLERKNIISELFFLKIIWSSVLILIYIYISYDRRDNLSLIFGIFILSEIINFDWVYVGLEKFSVITRRTITIKIISLILMYFSINDKSDYLIYALIIVFSQMMGNLWTFFNIRNYFLWSYRGIKEHIIKLKFYFFSSILATAYTTLNNSILGYYSFPTELAYFVRAKQFISLGLSLTGAMSSAMLPVIISNFTKDKKEYEKNVLFSLDFISFFSFFIIVILFGLAREISLLVGGLEFLNGASIIRILSPLTLVVPIGIWLYYSILIPLNKEKINLISQCVMALLSIVLNLMYVKDYGAKGASYIVLCIEFIGVLIVYTYTKLNKLFTMKISFKNIRDDIFAGTVILTLIMTTKDRINDYFTVLLIIPLYFFLYTGLLFFLKNTFVYALIKKATERMKNVFKQNL